MFSYKHPYSIIENYKAKHPHSIIEHHALNSPTEMFIAIFVFMDDRSLLAFILSSKSLSVLFNEKNKLWKNMMTPRLDAEQCKFIKNEDYQKIWRKRINVKVDFSTMFPSYGESFFASDLLNIYIKTQHKYSSTQYVYFKEVTDPDQINQFIKEDNDVALFQEASRLGDMLHAILENDINLGNDALKIINLGTNSRFLDMNSICTSDYNFILSLMPYILDTHAKKCFELFIRTFYFGYQMWCGDKGHSMFKQSGFPLLENIIFESNNPYFIFKFIELTFKFADDTHFMKQVIQTCFDKNMVDLLRQALNKIDLSSKKYLPLLEDKAVCEIINPGNEVIQHIQLKKDYEQARKKYIDFQPLIQNALLENTRTSSELQEMFDTSQQLAVAIIKARSNLENNHLTKEVIIEPEQDNSFRLSF